MNNVFQKRLQKLDRIRHPPMTIEELLAWCDVENRQPIHYVPGESTMLDFLQAMIDELKNAPSTNEGGA